jgi:phage repressor protein C with HTH and peptisase S24 domain
MPKKLIKHGGLKGTKDRVRWAINYIAEYHGMTNEKIAKEIGCATSTINSYRRMVTDPGLDFFAYMARKFKFNLDWFAFGQGEPFPGARVQYPEVCSPELSDFTTIPPQPDFPSDDFVFIRQVNGKISAGGGLMPDNSVDLQCAFRKDWIEKRGGKPSNMSLIKVSGDSMVPTLLPGDLVLVDHSRTTVTLQGGIYAISIDQEIMIKRIQVLFHENKLRILSDNTHYESIEADPDKVKINGKVIWFGREMEK